MAVNETFQRQIATAKRKRAFDGRAAIAAAVVLVVISFTGFGPKYYFDLGNAFTSFRWMTHAHALIMVLWMALFAAQVFFVRTKNIKTHITLGMAGVVLALLVIATGSIVGVQAGKYGSVSFPPNIPRLSFMIVPLGDILVFAVLFAAAIYYRRTPANHRRLMILTAINFLSPALARINIEALQNLGPLYFWGFPDALGLILLGADTWRNRRLNPAFAIGLLLIIASQPLRLMISGTETWLAFAAWLTR